jgi:hypothetical protein
VAKWVLLSAAAIEGQWWWAAVMLTGGLLAGAYVFMVLGKALSKNGALTLRAPIARDREILVLAVALCAVLLGLVPFEPSDFLAIGRPEMQITALQ